MVGDLQRRRDDEEEMVYRPAVHRVELDPLTGLSVSDPQATRDQRAAVGDRDPPAEPGGAEALAPLKDPQQGLRRRRVPVAGNRPRALAQRLGGRGIARASRTGRA